MSWLKLDDQIAFHRKVLGAGNEAFGCWVRMAAQSAQELLDGKVPRATAMAIALGNTALLETLCTVGLLDHDGDDYRIHDFLDYNPSAKQVRKLREDRSRAGTRGGKKSALVRVPAPAIQGTPAQKYHAHYAVAAAVKDGRLTRLPCEVCGAQPAEAHHDDYLKPLDVRWLCSAHHHGFHAEYRRGNVDASAQALASPSAQATANQAASDCLKQNAAPSRPDPVLQNNLSPRARDPEWFEEQPEGVLIEAPEDAKLPDEWRTLAQLDYQLTDIDRHFAEFVAWNRSTGVRVRRWVEKWRLWCGRKKGDEQKDRTRTRAADADAEVERKAAAARKRAPKTPDEPAADPKAVAGMFGELLGKWGVTPGSPTPGSPVDARVDGPVAKLMEPAMGVELDLREPPIQAEVEVLAEHPNEPVPQFDVEQFAAESEHEVSPAPSGDGDDEIPF